MSYGRHQSFYLKKHWINKGIKALDHDDNKSVFIDKDGFKNLGIGKNMQQSLRYWLEATNIIEYVPDTKKHDFTYFGKCVQQYDAGCTKVFTQLLIHYFLVYKKINHEPFSHVFYWFFLVNNDYFVSREKIKEELVIFSEHSVSENTISRDIDCLFQTYTNKQKTHPEDKNIAILASLDLIIKENNLFIKSAISRNIDTALVFYFIINQLKDDISLSIESVTDNIGRLFNLNRTEIIECIEILTNEGFPIDITRTNNLDTIVINEEMPIDDLLNYLFKKVLSYEN